MGEIGIYTMWIFILVLTHNYYLCTCRQVSTFLCNTLLNNVLMVGFAIFSKKNIKHISLFSRRYSVVSRSELCKGLSGKLIISKQICISNFFIKKRSYWNANINSRTLYHIFKYKILLQMWIKNLTIPVGYIIHICIRDNCFVND